MSLLTKQVPITTKTLLKACDQMQDEKDRKEIVDGIEKVKEVEK